MYTHTYTHIYIHNVVPPSCKWLKNQPYELYNYVRFINPSHWNYVHQLCCCKRGPQIA